MYSDHDKWLFKNMENEPDCEYCHDTGEIDGEECEHCNKTNEPIEDNLERL